MKRKILILAAVMTMFFAFGAINVNAASSGTCGDNLTWVLGDEGTLTISGTGDMWDCVHDSTPWDSLKYNIKNILIDDGVTSIGEFAFYECSNLMSIEIPDSVTSIGYSAFYLCRSLTSIELGNGVTSIGDWAFFCCDSLTSIEIPNSVTSIGEGVFASCDSLTSIELSDNVTSIGYFAFSCRSLTSIEIPDSVTSIGECAFYECWNLDYVYYTGTQAQWNAISIDEDDNDALTHATIIYNYDVTAQVSDAITKYISDENKATGFTATITNGKYTTEAIESVIWEITPAGGTEVEIPVDLPTTLTLDYDASAIIGIVLDGLYDENATAALTI